METVELIWDMEYPKRRTSSEQAKLTAMIEEYVAANDCRYDIDGDLIEETVRQTPEDKHHFTPTERITLDYEGQF